MKVWFIIAFLLFTLSMQAKCINGKIEYIFNRKKIIEKSSYCFGDELISQKCSHKKCSQIEQPPRPIKIPDYTSQYGTPGFKLCFALQGSPQIMKYWNEKDWIATSRCIFTKDEYIEIEALMKKWRNFIVF